MSTFQLLSLISNIVLAIALLYVVFSGKIISYIKSIKRRGEKRANLERARFTKLVREEVRRYLEELQK